MSTEFNASRRSFLLGAAAASALLAAPTAGTAFARPAFAAASDPHAAVLARRREFLTGGTVAAEHPKLADKRATIDADVQKFIDTFNREPGRTWLWPGLEVNAASNTAEVANMGVTANEITSLATTWASAGSIHYQDPDLLSDLQGALDFLSGQFRADRGHPGNWWFWEIGVPRQVADTLTLLGDGAPADATSKLLAACRFHAPDPNVRRDYSSLKETGANRVDKALSCIVRGLLDKTDSDITLGRDALSDVKGNGANSLFGLVTSGDGFYADGSFIQHGYLPYSGTYGGVAIRGVGEVLAMLAGSAWAVTDPNLGNLLDAIEKTFAPFQWDVRAMDTTRGRAVTRQHSQDFESGFAIASAVIVLAESAPAEKRAEYRALVRGWLERTDDHDVATNSQGLAASARSVAVLEDAEITAESARQGITNTVHQERMVQHRGEWAAVVSTSSKRIGRYEWGNRENALGWYQGDGLFYLYHRNDSGQFSDNFWPTVDPYALPGITVNGEERESGKAAGTGIPRAKNAYAGGVTAGGLVGTTAMDLTNATGALTANKSWFFGEDAVVCLGTGISDSSGTGARTILENRSFVVGEIPVMRLDGSEAALTGDPASATSAHINDHAGFVSLPVPGKDAQQFAVSAETRSGTWKTINDGGDTGGDDTEVSRDYVRISQEHDEASDWYAYAVLPLIEPDAVKDASSTASVLLADADAHVVAIGENLTMGHFFAAGTFGDFTADGPCAFAWRAVPKKTPPTTTVTTEVVIAQPTTTGGTVTLTFPVDAPGEATESDASVTVVSTAPLTLSVNVSGTLGAEHRIVFTDIIKPGKGNGHGYGIGNGQKNGKGNTHGDS